MKLIHQNAYMNEGGLNCPDYWINVESNKNNTNSCRNAYKIPNISGEVITDETFPSISDEVWNSSEERGSLDGVKTRCNWLNTMVVHGKELVNIVKYSFNLIKLFMFI